MGEETQVQISLPVAGAGGTKAEVPPDDGGRTPLQELGSALVASRVPRQPEVIAPKSPVMQLDVESVDTAGRKFSLSVGLRNDQDFRRWGLLERAAVAKADIKNPWSKESLPTIVNAIVFAERLGLSFEEGDVYPSPDGRLAVTAKARIKRALATGLIARYEVETVEGENIEIPWQTFKERGTWSGPNLTTTVTVHVKGWEEPFIYKATLKEWFTGVNPNWKQRPRYMLELNAIGHALDRVVPAGGVGPEEAPPLDK